MFSFINFLLSKFIEKTNLSRFIFFFYSRILPVPEAKVRGVKIKVAMPLNLVGHHSSFKRWNTREKETLDWIDNFSPDSIFFDIGANFGNETLYAAKKKLPPKKILCFDLDLVSSYLLAQNIQLNNIDNVEQFFVAIGCDDIVNFSGEHTNYSCVKGRPKYDTISFNTLGISVDNFIKKTNVYPNYVKIDVDGTENNLILGMKELLKNPCLKSILVEVDNNTISDVRKTLNEFEWNEISESKHGKTSNLIFEKIIEN